MPLFSLIHVLIGSLRDFPQSKYKPIHGVAHWKWFDASIVKVANRIGDAGNWKRGLKITSFRLI